MLVHHQFQLLSSPTVWMMVFVPISVTLPSLSNLRSAFRIELFLSHDVLQSLSRFPTQGGVATSGLRRVGVK